MTNGAGNYAGFLNRCFQYKVWPSQLAPASGSMGYGLPAAIAAKLIHPERAVVALAGDGCALMTGQELATAAQYAVPIIMIVVNNGTPSACTRSVFTLAGSWGRASLTLTSPRSPAQSAPPASPSSRRANSCRCCGERYRHRFRL